MIKAHHLKIFACLFATLLSASSPLYPSNVLLQWPVQEPARALVSAKGAYIFNTDGTITFVLDPQNPNPPLPSQEFFLGIWEFSDPPTCATPRCHTNIRCRLGRMWERQDTYRIATASICSDERARKIVWRVWAENGLLFPPELESVDGQTNWAAYGGWIRTD